MLGLLPGLPHTLSQSLPGVFFLVEPKHSFCLDVPRPAIAAVFRLVLPGEHLALDHDHVAFVQVLEDNLRRLLPARHRVPGGTLDSLSVSSTLAIVRSQGEACQRVRAHLYGLRLLTDAADEIDNVY